MALRDPNRDFLRHALATIAYRAAKAEREAPPGMSTEKLFQGPIADSLTHVGQIAMLRRLADAPVRGESYSRADIVVGRLGTEQPKSPFEFD